MPPGTVVSGPSGVPGMLTGPKELVVVLPPMFTASWTVPRASFPVALTKNEPSHASARAPTWPA